MPLGLERAMEQDVGSATGCDPNNARLIEPQDIASFRDPDERA